MNLYTNSILIIISNTLLIAPLFYDEETNVKACESEVFTFKVLGFLFSFSFFSILFFLFYKVHAYNIHMYIYSDFFLLTLRQMC